MVLLWGTITNMNELITHSFIGYFYYLLVKISKEVLIYNYSWLMIVSGFNRINDIIVILIICN